MRAMRISSGIVPPLRGSGRTCYSTQRSTTPTHAKPAWIGDPGTRWAKLFRAYNAGFPANSFHCHCRNIVLTQTLTPWANSNSAPAGLVFSHSIHRGKRNIALTHTLKPSPFTKRVQTEFFRSLFSRALSKLIHETRSRKGLIKPDGSTSGAKARSHIGRLRTA